MNKVIAAALFVCAVAFGPADAQQHPPPLRIAPSPLLTIDQHRQSVVDGIVAAWRNVLMARYGGTIATEEAVLRTSLMGLRSDRLLAASVVDSFTAVEELIAESQHETTASSGAVLKNLGDPSVDLTYTPVDPCRIVDTRNAGGALVPNVVRTFDGYNASSFAFQGGTASDCQLPSDAAVIAMNVYAISPTNLGFIKVWSASATEPAVSTVNYQVGISAIANGAIVPVDGAHNNRFDVKSPATVHFVADVVGYFKPPGDARGLDILVNGTRAMRFEYNATSPNVIGGFSGNSATGRNIAAATIGGGGAPGTAVPVGFGSQDCHLGSTAFPCSNSVSDSYGTVAGGVGNLAGASGFGMFATVGGGIGNTASGSESTVAGGYTNSAGGSDATVSGGSQNSATGFGSTVAGGTNNTASGPAGSTVTGGDTNSATAYYSTIAGGTGNSATGSSSIVAGGSANTASGSSSIVAGGSLNIASGTNSFAAGYRAQASQDGCFVWADTSINAPIGCFANTFVVRAFGGVAMATGGSNPNYTGARLAAGSGSWSSFSDRNAKEDVRPTDADAVLARVAALPVSTWNWRAQAKGIRHMGPMAQDFYDAFGLGEDNTHISSVDIEGVALAAIQGLNANLQARVAEKNREIAELRDRLNHVESVLAQLTAAKAKEIELSQRPR